MKFRTSITNIQNGEEIIRGEKLENLVKNHSFVETVFLILIGKLPTEKEKHMLDAILISVIDHGPGVASAMAARISASAKNPLHSSLAAGLLAFGERHGMAVEGGMIFLNDQRTKINEQSDYDLALEIKKLKEQKFRIPGYGHKVFTDVDPRSETLFALARELEIFGDHCQLAHDVHRELNAISSRQLPINVDGAIAPILCDMGFDSKLGNGIFLIGRLPGLIAHIVEENNSGEGIRRMSQDEIEFE